MHLFRHTKQDVVVDTCELEHDIRLPVGLELEVWTNGDVSHRSSTITFFRIGSSITHWFFIHIENHLEGISYWANEMSNEKRYLP